MNSQTISAIKKQSETDGVRTRATRPAAARSVSAGEDAGVGASDSTGDGECVEVAKVTGVRSGRLVPFEMIDLAADFH
jgi:hypothetical protein